MSGTINQSWDNYTFRIIPTEWQLGQCTEWRHAHHLYFQLANALFFLAFLAPNGPYGMLWLRCCLVIGSCLIAMWGWMIECTLDAVVWAGIFVITNLIYVGALLIYLRPVKFDKEIEAIFYYQKRKNAAPLGRLYTKYHNRKSKYKQVPQETSTSTIKKTIIINDNADDHIRALKYKTLSRQEVLEHWRGCMGERLTFINNTTSTKDIMEAWPKYKESDGYKLIYVTLFKPLRVSRHQFKKVLNCMKMVRSLKYQEVYAQEKVTKVDSLSLVLSGKLVVSQNQRALHIVFPHQFLDSPEWFGVSTDDYFQVSIMAMEESRVLIWHRDKLKLSIMAEPFLQAVFDHILGRDVVKKLMQVTQVSETMAATNGFLPGGYDDSEDKPMLMTKKSNEGHGITALINRQLQEEHAPLLVHPLVFSDRKPILTAQHRAITDLKISSC